MKKEHEYELNAAIQELNQFCLIDVDRADRSTRILSTYRLLQDILKDEMTDDEKRESAGRAVQALSHAFPEDIQFRYWRSCQHYLPHAMECKAYIEQLNISSQEALLLLDRVGCYLQERADYSKAEGFHKLALKIREQKLGSVHPDIAGNINRLAEIYHAQGEYAKAKPYYERAKEILEKSDIQGIDLATILNNMGRLYDDRGDYEEAEKLYLRAQHICEGLNPRHLYISVILNNLASLHFRQAKNKKQLIIQGKKAKQLYKEAGQLYKRAIVISRQTLGPDHPNTIQSLANLASVYLAQKRYGAAEKLYRQALMVSESTIGPDHPQIAARLNNLAELYREQEKYDLARPLYEKARIIYEQRLGPNHPSLANVLSNYATLLESEENHREALRLRKQAEDILKKHAQANP